MRLTLYFAGLLHGLLWAAAATAQEGDFESAPPPPEIPESVPERSVPDTRPEDQPEVTIIHRGEDVVTEYRMNGQLYAVKITPARGLPYYLIDRDGDGSLETRRNDLDSPPIPEWPILRW